jgi:glycolate oxidase
MHMTTKYNPITPRIVDELIAILGPTGVLVDPEAMEPYSRDEEMKNEHGHMPEVVVKPANARETAEVVKLANRELIPITPRGAGSGLCGGAVPIFGGIVISLEKMNAIIEIDAANLTFTAGAGIVTNEINHAVRDLGLFYAGYPMSVESCYLGGNIATDAGGGKAVKYGVTRRYVLGLELVTPLGEIVQLGGKLAKDVAGYDLKQLIIGAEGTLGIITQATVRLVPLPKARSAILALFPTPQAAIDMVPRIMTSGNIPASLEYIDRRSFDEGSRFVGDNLSCGEAEAVLLIEFDGATQEGVDAQAEAVGDLCMGSGAIEVYVADNFTTLDRVWNIRRNVADAFLANYAVNCLEDIVVPVSMIPLTIPMIEQAAGSRNLESTLVGHAGDGNMHAILLKKNEMSLEEWNRVLPQALEEIYRKTTELGGKITGEHGIGFKRKEALVKVTQPVEMELMRSIKRAWDPNHIMNPGKVLDV